MNPAHLFLGTNADNQADKARKGRAAKKLKVHDADAIKELKSLGLPTGFLAEYFSVSRTTIRYIVRGLIWRNLSKCQIGQEKLFEPQ